MSTKQRKLDLYSDQPMEKRIRYLMRHYKDYELFEAALRQEIELNVAEARAYERNKHEELGVRIMSGTSLKDITYEQAKEAIEIADSLNKGGRPDDMVRDWEDKEYISQLVENWRTFKRDYAALNSQLLKLGDENYAIFIELLRREKNYQQLADELMIEIDSVKKKMKRLKRKVIQLITVEYQEKGLFRDLRYPG